MTRSISFPLVVLDCDGTLVDSQSAIHAIMVECFTSHGLAAPDIASVRRIVGLNLDDAMSSLMTEPCDVRPADLSNTYRAVSSRFRAQSAFFEPLFPGARETIGALRDAGYVLGIATGKSLRGLRNTLSEHGIEQFFDTLRTSDQAPGKPDPTMLRQAMRDVGADPQATVMVGDTTYDMEMARAAGTYAVGVGWGYHEVEALQSAGAHRIIASYADLPAVVTELLGWSVGVSSSPLDTAELDVQGRLR